MIYDCNKLNTSCSTKIYSLFLFVFLMLVSFTGFAQTTLVQYNFEGSVSPSINNTMSVPSLVQSGLSTAAISTAKSCNGSHSLAGSGWDTGDYYLLRVNTTGYENLVFSYCNSASNNSNLNSFEVSVSTDSGVSYTNVISSYTPTTSNVTKTSSTFPSSTNNNSDVWIRIYKDANAKDNRILYIDDMTLVSCPTYSLTSTSWTQACVNSTASINVNGLPNGTYTVTYNTSLPLQTGLTATMTSSGGTGSFTATGFNNNGSSNVTITNISSGSCSTIISSNNTATVLRGSPSNPVPNTYSINTCKSATGTFSISTVANASSYTWTTTATGWTIIPASDGLSATVTFGASATAGSLVVAAINSCGSNSATISVGLSTSNPTVAAIGGGSASVCVGANTAAFTNTTSGGTWSISSGTGTASITTGGVVTGLTAGTVTVNYSVQCTTVTKSLTIGSVAPGAITQPSSKCASSTGNVFSITAVSGATSYMWSVTGTGWSVASGGNTISATITIGSGSGTVSVTATNACGTSSASTTGTIVTNSANIAGAASTSPIICLNSSITPVTHTTTGATGIGTATGLPTGVTASWASNTITISGTPTATGVYNYSIPLVGECSSGITATGTIAVKEVAPLTTTVTNVTCSNSSDGSIVSTLDTMPLEFINADDDYIDLGSAILSNRSAFTVEGWIKFKAADIGSRISLFGQNDVVEFFLNSGVMQLYTASGGSVTYTYPASLGNNAWHHIAATGNGTNIKIFIDGIQVVSGGYTTSNYGTSTAYTAKIGSGVVDATGGGFTGQIYKTGFYSTALSSATIAALASSPTVYLGTESGLLAGYNFNSTGTSLTRLPSGASGTLVNTPVRVDSFYTYSWSGPSSFTASTRDISGLAVGIYVLTATGPVSNSCPLIKNFVVGSTNTTPTAPTIFSTTQPTCVTPTGSLVLNGLPSVGTWTLTRSPGAVTTVGAGESVSVSSLAVGSYTFTVTNAAGCTSVASNTVIINPAVIPINTYNGSWSAGTPPPPTNGTQKLVFESNFVSTANISGCSCEVKSTVSYVNINSGHTVSLINELTVDSAATMTFFDSASLVQQNNVQNTGGIYYKRTTYSRDEDYTYWSSPVAGQTLGDLISDDATFYSYEATASSEDWAKASSVSVMTAGKGYIASPGLKIPTVGNPPSTELAVTFLGVPNNGNYSSPVFSGKSCLLGNPYPSAISAESFLSTNTGILDGTLYFWTHNTAIQDRNYIIGIDENGNPKAGTGAYAFTSDDYATYNGTGGAAVSAGKIPNGYIAAGQGFFGTAVATASVAYTNGMRVSGTTTTGQTGINEQFFKKRGSTKETLIEKNRLWLNLTNTQGAFKQTLVGYVTNATNGYESSFDGESYDGNSFVDFYSVNNDKHLTIQGRALPFDENDEVPMGYKTTIAGDFTIAIEQVDGSLENQAVFIEDKLTNTTFNLKKGNYTFSTVEGTFDDRFVLRYKNTNSDVNDNSLSATDFDAQSNKVLVSIKNKEIKVNSFSETIDKVVVFDLLGRQVYKKDQVNSNELSIVTLSSSHQALIVKTTLQNGVLVTDKIIY